MKITPSSIYPFGTSEWLALELHREHTNTAPAKMMICRDQGEFQNPNVSHYHGRIESEIFRLPGKANDQHGNELIGKLHLKHTRTIRFLFVVNSRGC